MNDNKSKEYILLTNLELKIDVLPCCPCLLSLNAMSLSLAAKIRNLFHTAHNFPLKIISVCLSLSKSDGKGLYLAI